MTHRKPQFSELRELQREYLQLRWNAVCARNDQSHYARSIDTLVVSHAMGWGRWAINSLTSGGAQVAAGPSAETRLNFENLPSWVDTSMSPFLPSLFLFFDAATCGLLARRRQFTNFADGMISYDADNGVLKLQLLDLGVSRARPLPLMSPIDNSLRCVSRGEPPQLPLETARCRNRSHLCLAVPCVNCFLDLAKRDWQSQPVNCPSLW